MRLLSQCINDIECSENFREEFKSTRDPVWSILAEFHRTLNHNLLNLSALGMFNINHEQYGAFVAGIIGYQIVMLQFYNDKK